MTLGSIAQVTLGVLGFIMILIKRYDLAILSFVLSAFCGMGTILAN